MYRQRKCHYLEEHPYHRIGIKVSVVAVSCSTGVLSTSTITERTSHPTLARLAGRKHNTCTRASLSGTDRNTSLSGPL